MVICLIKREFKFYSLRKFILGMTNFTDSQASGHFLSPLFQHFVKNCITRIFGIMATVKRANDKFLRLTGIEQNYYTITIVKGYFFISACCVLLNKHNQLIDSPFQIKPQQLSKAQSGHLLGQELPALQILIKKTRTNLSP